MEINQVSFLVEGSSPEPYAVVFTKSAELLASCTCAAGKVGQYCKHRLNILAGDVSAVVSNNQTDVEYISQWLIGTRLAAALAAVEVAETELELAKKKANDAKKALGRVMQTQE